MAPGARRHALAVRYATEHRAGVVIRGPGLCDRVTGTGAPRGAMERAPRRGASLTPPQTR